MMKVRAEVSLGAVSVERSVVAQPLPGHWVKKAPMPTPRTEVAVAELLGKIYVVGGLGGDGRTVEMYDPRTDRWEVKAPLPTALHHTSLVALGGKVYVIGGYSAGWRPASTTYEYDPE